MSVFFDPAGFTRTALLKGTTNITVQFFDGYEDAINEESGIASSVPSALVKSSDIVGVVQGDTLQIDGVEYKIAEIEPDDPGGITAGSHPGFGRPDVFAARIPAALMGDTGKGVTGGGCGSTLR